MTKSIGVIGLGIMGKPMAMNLLKAGFNVCLFARNPNALKPFESQKLKSFSTPAELARNCDITLCIVSDTPDAHEVLIGENSVLHGAHREHIVIDMSTISPEITREIANTLDKKDIRMLDAPVSGGEIGAIKGELSIMVGGKKNTFNQAHPILSILGKNIVHVGDHGAGQVAKICNQILVAQTMAAVAEAFLLAKSFGVDPAKVREALLGGFAYSKILEVHGQRILTNDYKPGFKANLHNKDMKIAMHSAEVNNINLPGAALVANYINNLVVNGDGELDSAAIAKEIMSGIN